MKIGIDTFGCEIDKSNVWKHFVSLLRKINSIKSDIPLEIELFGLESNKYDFESVFSEIKESESNIELKYVSVNLPESHSGVELWHSFRCNLFFKKQEYDVVVFLDVEHFLPIKCDIPSVVILNEVLSTRFANLSFWGKLKLKLSLKHIKKIIVPSQFVKKDLKSMHINMNKVSVIHSGLDHSIFYPRGDSEIETDVVDIKPFAIQKPYFIYVSKISASYKQHCELVKAFSLFKEKTKLPHRLVLAGGEGESFENVKKAISESNFASDIFMTGYYPHEDYPNLYAGSEGCIYPSVCEGIGMPVLEAMAMKIPVACSKSGAIPEIAGEYAIFFDGYSVNDIEIAIEKLVSEDSSVKNKRIDDAFRWASRFTLKKSIEEIILEIKNTVLYKKNKKR